MLKVLKFNSFLAFLCLLVFSANAFPPRRAVRCGRCQLEQDPMFLLQRRRLFNRYSAKPVMGPIGRCCTMLQKNRFMERRRMLS